MNGQQKLNLLAREILSNDFNNGLIDTLDRFETEEHKRKHGYLTVERALNIYRIPVEKKIFVTVDKNTGNVIGTATLISEQKLIHNGMKVGHIEDVAARLGYERLGAASLAVNAALKYANSVNCKRLVLGCSEGNVGFHEKLGFNRHGVAMRYEF